MTQEVALPGARWAFCVIEQMEIYRLYVDAGVHYREKFHSVTGSTSHKGHTGLPEDGDKAFRRTISGRPCSADRDTRPVGPTSPPGH